MQIIANLRWFFKKPAKKHNALSIIHLELVSGLRKGELAALRWDNLDTESNTISVSKQYVHNPNGEVALTRPKTEISIRRIPIPQTVVTC